MDVVDPTSAYLVLLGTWPLSLVLLRRLLIHVRRDDGSVGVFVGGRFGIFFAQGRTNDDAGSVACQK